MVQKIYSKMHPGWWTTTHQDVPDLVNYGGVVKNTKTWISPEWDKTFLWNKKIYNLCLWWHILRSRRFFSGTNLYKKVAGFLLYIKKRTLTQAFSCFLQNTHRRLLLSLKTAPITIAINVSHASYQKWIQTFLFFWQPYRGFVDLFRNFYKNSVSFDSF